MTDERKRHWRAFMRRMRKAGWSNEGHGWFVHGKTGAEFYAHNSTKWRLEKYGYGAAWWPFHLNGTLPTDAPF